MKQRPSSSSWVVMFGLLGAISAAAWVDAAELRIDPAAELRLFYDGYPHSVGARAEAGQAAAVIFELGSEARTPTLDWDVDLDLAHEAHRQESSLDVLDLALRSGLTRKLSPNSAFRFDVGASQSTRSGIGSSEAIIVLPTLPGLTTRRGYLGVGAGLQVSPRSRFHWRVSGDALAFDGSESVAFDERGNVVLQENQAAEAGVSWEFLFPRRSSVALGYDARRFWFELSPSATVQAVHGELHSGVGPSTQWYISAGPAQVEIEDPARPNADPLLEVEIDTSVETRTTPLSVLSIGAGRRVSPGSGLGGVSVDQTAFVGWARRPLRGMTMMFVLSGWRQDVLEPSTITTEVIEQAEYLELREELMWGIGRSMWLGVHHGYRYAAADTLPGAQYHIGGFVVRWDHGGRAEPPFSRTAAGQRLAAAFADSVESEASAGAAATAESGRSEESARLGDDSDEP